MQFTLPPCLPFTIRAEISSFRGANKDALSKVTYTAIDSLPGNKYGMLIPMAQIKRVSLRESEIGSAATFAQFFDVDTYDLLFNELTPDITLTYNKAKLDEINFSLDVESVDKYDFVTMVLRDIAYGLGFGSRFRKDPTQDALMPVVGLSTRYELYIWAALGDDLKQAYANATKGVLATSVGRLYAPEIWDDNLSLKTYAGTASQLDELLSYQFGKGYIYRGLDAKSWYNITYYSLDWTENYLVGIGGSESEANGTTEDKMPYKGSLSFDFGNTAMSSLLSDDRPAKSQLRSMSTGISASEVLEKMHPFYVDGSVPNRPGLTVAVLLNDGYWDVVYSNITYMPFESFEISMDELEFHHDIADYARNCDGLLRGRITRCTEFTDPYRGPRKRYTTQFFNIDHLPQTIEMTIGDSNGAAQQAADIAPLAASATREVKVGMCNLEGLTRVVVERKREGYRVPTRIEVPDFKKGYFVTSVDTDRQTTFTAIGYNANGSTRSLPVTVDPVGEAVQRFSMTMAGDELNLTEVLDGDVQLCGYEITPLQARSLVPVRSGVIDRAMKVNVADLPDGIYVLVCYDEDGNRYTYKFNR